MDYLDQIYESVLKGKAPQTTELVQNAVAHGMPVNDMISSMNRAMEEVGQRFSRNEIFLPEMMIAARAMKSGMEILEPLIAGQSTETKGKFLIGTIKGDLHDIGKNLMITMFRGAGFEVIDIGVDVPKERFLQKLKDESPQLLGISALLTTVLPELKEAIRFLKESEIGNTCKIMVGGAAVDAAFASKAGADGYADDAGEAIQVAKKLLANGNGA